MNFIFIALQVIQVKVALVQYTADNHFGDKAKNLENLTTYFEQAVSREAKLIVLPEGSDVGYESEGRQTWCAPELIEKLVANGVGCHDVREVAEPVPSGPLTQYWSSMAQKHEVYIVFSVIELTEAGRFARTAVVVGPKGYVTKYRKARLWSNETYFNAEVGQHPVVFETEFGRFGLLICYDWGKKNFWQFYSREGLRAVIFQTDWVGNQTRAYFGGWAKEYGVSLLATDDTDSNGTDYFLKTGAVVPRDGITDQAEEGVSVYELQ